VSTPDMSYRADIEVPLRQRIKELEAEVDRQKKLGDIIIEDYKTEVERLQTRLKQWEEQDCHEAMECYHNGERADRAEARAERLEKALRFIAAACEPCDKPEFCLHCKALEPLKP
jgi:uncharacterized protein (DUF305 family)